MDIHAEALKESALADDELTAFIRLGSDNVNNYYEYEVPLKLTAPGYYGSDLPGREAVWPEANRIEVPLRLFQELKLRRNTEIRAAGREIDYSEVYGMLVSELDENTASSRASHRIKVKGKPTLGDVRNVVIGIRNPRGDRMKGERSVEVWVNELRFV